MTCFALFYRNKQSRVFSYDPLKPGDRQRALALANDFCDGMVKGGYAYSIEEFGLSGVGVTVRHADNEVQP